MWGRKGGRGGEAGEQQIRAPGDPCFSFSSSSFSLCIRRGFDKKFVLGSAVQTCTYYFYVGVDLQGKIISINYIFISDVFRRKKITFFFEVYLFNTSIESSKEAISPRMLFTCIDNFQSRKDFLQFLK